MYPPLPYPPAIDPTDTAQHYGSRILRWILETDVYCTVPDEALRLAEHAAHTTVTAPGILPIAVDRISACRHEIARTLRRRAQLAQETRDAGELGAHLPPAVDTPDGPEGGTRVPRDPYPIAPAPSTYARPPAPVLNF